MSMQNLSQIINAHQMPENTCVTDFEYLIHLTFLVLKLEYSKIHWSISLMLMSWFFVSPGHQATLVLFMLDKWALVFPKEGFQQPVPCQY